MKCYLAGVMEAAYAGTNEAEAWRQEAYGWFERNTDITVISPTNYYAYGENIHKTDFEIMRSDLRKVKECDVVLVNLDKIRQSLGTSDEILYAYLNGKTIVGFLITEKKLTENEISNIIHPWKYEQIDRIEAGKDAMPRAMNYIVRYYS